VVPGRRRGEHELPGRSSLRAQRERLHLRRHHQQRGRRANISYFPLDGQGFGNQGENHNFSFTTEIQTSFTYHGGEIFTFAGDDDVWVFINDKLAIDLGGIHLQETQTVDLDAQASNLGISKGNVYPLAVFNAERHVVQSNFRIDTTLVFNDCGQTGGTAIIP
jgi:fibro-slime domain-containing protein